MRRSLSTCFALALLVFPAAAQAQTYVFFGGGAIMPLGDTKDALKTGYLGNVGIGRNIGMDGALSVNAEGIYGSSKYKVGTGSFGIYGAFANIEYDIAHTMALHPYVYAGGGMLGSKPEGGDSDTKGAYQVGVGFGYKMTSAWTFWGDARYLATSGDNNLTLAPITFGFSYSGFGKK